MSWWLLFVLAWLACFVIAVLVGKYIRRNLRERDR